MKFFSPMLLVIFNFVCIIGAEVTTVLPSTTTSQHTVGVSTTSTSGQVTCSWNVSIKNVLIFFWLPAGCSHPVSQIPDYLKKGVAGKKASHPAWLTAFQTFYLFCPCLSCTAQPALFALPIPALLLLALTYASRPALPWCSTLICSDLLCIALPRHGSKTEMNTINPWISKYLWVMNSLNLLICKTFNFYTDI